MDNKSGQHEMVGFVLIVVIVVIAMMVFLVISTRNAPESSDSLEVSHILNALMEQTTSCAIVYEPDYDNIADLFKSCHKNNQCTNLNRNSCDYLQEVLIEVLDKAFETENEINSYSLNFSEVERTPKIEISKGVCKGEGSSAQQLISSENTQLLVRLRLCKDI